MKNEANMRGHIAVLYVMFCFPYHTVLFTSVKSQNVEGYRGWQII